MISPDGRVAGGEGGGGGGERAFDNGSTIVIIFSTLREHTAVTPNVGGGRVRGVYNVGGHRSSYVLFVSGVWWFWHLRNDHRKTLCRKKGEGLAANHCF